MTDIHFERGYFWHKECAAILDGRLRDFPSQGQLIPDTILHNDDGIQLVSVYTCATCGKQWRKEAK